MKNFSRVLKQAWEEAPDRTALTLLYSQAPEQSLTYQELIAWAGGYAHLFAEAGIRSGEVVILILPHGLDLVASFFGAVLHGAIPSIMPFLTEKLSPEVYRASLKALFEITAPAAVVTYPEFESQVQEASSSSSVRSVFVSGQATPIYTPDWERLGGLARSPEEIVLLQHSSGTTGLQKGVALSHQAVFNQLDSYAQALKLNAHDVIVSWLPLYHDMGLIAGFILPLLRRVHLVLMSPFDWVRAPYRLMQAISQYRGTLCWLPNFAYNFCAQKIRDRELEGVDLSSMRAFINCSEPMYWNSHQMFLQRFAPYGLQPEALATCYAMAENVFAVTQGGIDGPVVVDQVDPRALSARRLAIPVQPSQSICSSSGTDENFQRLLSAGRAIPGVSLRILDSHGRDLPDRHIGEIALQSNCMLSGYYHRPDLTAKAFLDGWYLTGDLGYLVNGELYVTGRKKDLIIVGGKNIYPQDIEALVSEVKGIHPGRVVAFGVVNQQAGTEDVVVVAEVEDEACLRDSRGDEIAELIRQRVTRGSEVALRYVYLVERGWLLKTSSGKMARSANREKYLHEIQAGMR